MIDPRINQITYLITNKRLDEARAICDKLAAEKPNDPYLIHALGLIDYLRKNYSRAIERFQKSISQVTNNANFYSNLGEALRHQDRNKEALAAFQEALLINPNFPKAHLGVANTLSMLKRYKDAMARFQFIIKLFPDFPQAYHYLGMMLTSQDRVKEAIPLIRKAIALKPDYDEAELSLANALEKDRQTQEALKIYQKLLEKKPHDSSIRNNYANLLRSLGLIVEAAEHLTTALKDEPNNLSPYFNLSGKRLAEVITPEELKRLETLVCDPHTQENKRSALHFTLAKYYEANGNVDQAFANYQKGNEIDQRIEPYNAENQEKVCSTLTSFFTSEFFTSRRHFGSESETPIFVFGIPRSGTTLVEQILASHPNVYGAGELKYISKIVQALSHAKHTRGYPDCLNNMDAIRACTLGESYVDQIKALVENSEDEILRITDKMPGNYMSLGVIALLLPKAKLINCRRNPLDNSLSCFTNRFTSVISYSRSLEDLGHNYQIYERLMAHWHQVLPMPILDVQYEEMVKAPEATSRKIVNFIGLEWHDNCLDFYDNKRQVKTASVEQIREPIYTSSVNKWHKYKKFLTPLIDALGEYAPQLETSASV